MNNRVTNLFPGWLSLAVLAMLCLALLAPASRCLALTKNVKPGYWNISVAYPRFKSQGSVAARANSASKASESAEYNTFLTESRKEVTALRSQGIRSEYVLKVVPTVSMDSGSLCSGYVERYFYTGGAHGATDFRAMTYGVIGGRVRAVQLSDLFVKGADPVAQASSAIIEELRKREATPSNVAAGSWKRLSPAQAKSFTVYKLGLVFLFGQGELGVEAEGPVKVLVPFDSLPGLDRNGILKPVIARANALLRTSLTGGRWKLVSIVYNDDRSFSGDEGATNWIEFRDGRVQGQAGLNRFSGSYSATADGRLKMGLLAMTRAANPPGSIAGQFERHIGEVGRFLFRDDSLILELPADVGVMKFRR